MEDHTNTTERRESLVNLMVRGPREDQNEDNFVTNNRDGGASGDELNSPHDISSKRHKYNGNQIQELECIQRKFTSDENTRLELATIFSVGKKQVQFWFQNKRSILKNVATRKIEFAAMKEDMENSICDPYHNKDTIRNKNIDEKEILNKHACLKIELMRIAIHADKFLGPSTFIEGSLTSMMENFGLELLTRRDETSDINVVDDLSLNEVDFEKYLSSPLSTNLVNKDLTLDKSMLLNLALDALNDLLKLAMSDEPFRVRSLDGDVEKLNIEEYARSFVSIIGIKPSHLRTKAIRSFSIVVCNSLTLVEMLMNKSQWVEMFLCIIVKVNTFDVISTGIGESKSCTLLLLEIINLQIETELQIISNVVPVREIQFLRFSQKHVEGTWIVSIDTIKEGSEQYKIEKCRRLPFGCIIQDVPNGYSKVIWIEHMEYDEIFVHHLYLPLIRAGLGFGIIFDSKGETGMEILAQHMTRNFCAGICTTPHKWKKFQIENGKGANFMMRKNINDPGEPIGWDILSYGGPMKNNIHITKGQNLESCIFLLCANGDDIIANQNSMLIFQDTCTDATGSLLVYAIVDSSKMNTVIGGGGEETLLSLIYRKIILQIITTVEIITDLPKKLIIDTNDIISHTIDKIKTALKCK
ncbi:hypothetical protein R3W88_016414 [Solanum pinnatisectum]|uniref:Homeobox domain-containing protein n=1 Tax=Solanum pinnatisectum TaxID=50273 RepID=A0AAV9KXB1_9SOLN|nr:hypothetical protein R3W88_016414 [Solanum pinnatisectum]